MRHVLSKAQDVRVAVGVSVGTVFGLLLLCVCLAYLSGRRGVVAQRVADSTAAAAEEERLRCERAAQRERESRTVGGLGSVLGGGYAVLGGIAVGGVKTQRLGPDGQLVEGPLSPRPGFVLPAGSWGAGTVGWEVELAGQGGRDGRGGAGGPPSPDSPGPCPPALPREASPEGASGSGGGGNFGAEEGGSPRGGGGGAYSPPAPLRTRSGRASPAQIPSFVAGPDEERALPVFASQAGRGGGGSWMAMLPGRAQRPPQPSISPGPRPALKRPPAVQYLNGEGPPRQRPPPPQLPPSSPQRQRGRPGGVELPPGAKRQYGPSVPLERGRPGFDLGDFEKDEQLKAKEALAMGPQMWWTAPS